MSGWGGGYVTDITYMTGYYRQQSPAMMALACLLGGVASPLPGPDDPVSYLELGCGQGFGALVLAASNPHWKVTAIDFNPAHIAAARAWAAQAGLDNVTLPRSRPGHAGRGRRRARRCRRRTSSACTACGAGCRLPCRPASSGCCDAKVKPGGAVHVSYNALPAWGAALGMQRMLRDCGRRLGRAQRPPGRGRPEAGEGAAGRRCRRSSSDRPG